jgi:hypothetical protein
MLLPFLKSEDEVIVGEIGIINERGAAFGGLSLGLFRG